MIKKLVSFIFIIIMLSSIILAVEIKLNYITVKHSPNQQLVIRLTDFSTNESIYQQNIIADGNGIANITVSSELKKSLLKVMVIKDGGVADYKYYTVYLVGGPIIIDYLNISTNTSTDSQNITNQTITTTSENQTIVNDTINSTNQNVENQTQNPIDENKITGSIIQDLGDTIDEIKYYLIGGFVFIVILIFVIIFIVKKRNHMSSIKIGNDNTAIRIPIGKRDNSHESRKLLAAERRLEIAQREINKIKNIEKIKEVEKNIVQQKAELKKLRHGR